MPTYHVLKAEQLVPFVAENRAGGKVDIQINQVITAEEDLKIR